MEETASTQPDQPMVPVVVENNHIPAKVIIERDWKEYLGESVLIVFSVLLALILTEAINKRHENQQTKEIIRGLREELSQNEQWETEQYAYHLQVVKNIDSAIANPAFQQQFLSDGVINFEVIAPRGVLLHDLNNVAWQVARQANIISKISSAEYGLLARIYDNQDRFLNLERQIGAVVLSRESRTTADNRVTLILLRDSYKAWVIGRAPNLLHDYKSAVQMLEHYQ